MAHAFRLPFEQLLKARFVHRPNRFVVEARLLESGESIRAFMPNPGRLWELLLPGAILWVTPQQGAHRKLGWLVLAVDRDKAPVFLHTHINNAVARYLLDARAIAGYEAAHVVRAEVPMGRSRFDFLLEDNQGPIYLEVKSCTLFGNGVAMFPDAVTERGRRHLIELQSLTRNGMRTGVLFLVHSNKVKCFMPDYHTDPAFSETFLAVRQDVDIRAVALRWRPDLSLAPRARLLPIPYAHVRQELADCGALLFIFEWPVAREREGVKWPKGYYVYHETLGDGLAQRLHEIKQGLQSAGPLLRFLARRGGKTHAIPIRSSMPLKPMLAPSLRRIGYRALPEAEGLYHTATHPFHDPAFHRLLERWRMTYP